MKIVGLGDIHAPFQDSNAIDAAIALIEEEKPDYVVQDGDLYDMYSFSRFAKNPNFVTPEHEMDEGRADMEDMWKRIRKAAPKAKLIQLKGNHDLRPIKYVKESAASSLHVMKKYLKDLMTFPGVELVEDEHEIEGIIFQHGHRRHGEHARYNQQNTVVAHTHKPGVVYHVNKFGSYWELNLGWLGDAESEAFSYQAQRKLHGMTVGVGLIDERGPRFVAL